MELGKKIRVLVVDDSALARNLIIQGLSSVARMRVSQSLAREPR